MEDKEREQLENRIQELLARRRSIEKERTRAYDEVFEREYRDARGITTRDGDWVARSVAMSQANSYTSSYDREMGACARAILEIGKTLGYKESEIRNRYSLW